MLGFETAELLVLLNPCGTDGQLAGVGCGSDLFSSLGPTALFIGCLLQLVGLFRPRLAPLAIAGLALVLAEAFVPPFAFGFGPLVLVGALLEPSLFSAPSIVVVVLLMLPGVGGILGLCGAAQQGRIPGSSRFHGVTAAGAALMGVAAVALGNIPTQFFYGPPGSGQAPVAQDVGVVSPLVFASLLALSACVWLPLVRRNLAPVALAASALFGILLWVTAIVNPTNPDADPLFSIIYKVVGGVGSVLAVFGSGLLTERWHSERPKSSARSAAPSAA